MITYTSRGNLDNELPALLPPAPSAGCPGRYLRCDVVEHRGNYRSLLIYTPSGSDSDGGEYSNELRIATVLNLPIQKNTH